LRAPPLPPAFHVAGKTDRAAEQQKLLGERGLAGVGMRDDREGAARAEILRPTRSFRIRPFWIVDHTLINNWFREFALGEQLFHGQ
jgi:hypothetical protein